MDDPFRMGCVQGVGYLNAECERGRDVHGLAADMLAQRFAIEQLHHQEGMTSRFAHIVDHADTSMIERRSGPRLTLEAFPRSLGCKTLRQHFYGDVAVEPHIPRFVNFPHSARTDGRNDLVWAELVSRGKRHMRVQLSL